ncbi:MAG TPA: molybdenum ABC transporter ATP-binding protein [Desulfuromonadales bacterium]|nr:molybdenum ABC transporter ATP-binding protein [Desulfuromonadales bacterium]
MNLVLNVQKSFPGFRLAADVSLTGDKIGIFGASGSGKSTLVSMLAGFQKPDAGEIILDGETLFSGSGKINVPPEKRRIAMVFQQHSLFPHLTVRNNLLYGYHRCRAEYRAIHLDMLVAVLQLEELLERDIRTLSGGQQQRIALGRAILGNPRLLLMDEPLSALDDTLRFQIIPYLKSVSDQFGIPYLFISHSLVEMRLMTDTVLAFAHGEMVGKSSSEQLARTRMGESAVGYINLLELDGMTERNGMCAYTWQGVELLLSGSNQNTVGGLFELSSKDIILFKRHPEAISARNLLECTVASLFGSSSKIGVELRCGTGRLVAEIVPEAARELGIKQGAIVYAAFKASAFRRLAITAG